MKLDDFEILKKFATLLPGYNSRHEHPAYKGQSGQGLDGMPPALS